MLQQHEHNSLSESTKKDSLVSSGLWLVLWKFKKKIMKIKYTKSKPGKWNHRQSKGCHLK